MPPSKQSSGSTSELLALSGRALMVGSSAIGGLVLGLVLDYFLGTTPWLTVVCTVGGIVSGMVRFIVTAMQVNDSEPTRGTRPRPRSAADAPAVAADAPTAAADSPAAAGDPASDPRSS